ncbi:MAG: hypothetical protein IKS18_09660 [Lachnospiraceae bacterium]|nr:hypothetical protein [Lachnospiraceae bacterium]
MKKLILIGDSIRMGYQREVEEILRDRMEVFGPNENGRWSGYTLNSLRFWMPEWPGADVIHLNVGLWDTGDDYGFGRSFTRLPDYRENLELILRVLREHYPGGCADPRNDDADSGPGSAGDPGLQRGAYGRGAGAGNSP